MGDGNGLTEMAAQESFGFMIACVLLLVVDPLEMLYSHKAFMHPSR